jgi:hypothetical protein
MLEDSSSSLGIWVIVLGELRESKRGSPRRDSRLVLAQINCVYPPKPGLD